MVPRTLALCFLACIPLSYAAVATELLKQLSFGTSDKISPNGRAIPGWHLVGEGHSPQILSDRVILTPPHPGHSRGSLWAENPNPEVEWTAEATFRASGQDRGSGNFQIWYVRDGQSVVGSNSVYTVPKFDGLVLTVDQHGGRGGMLRGFLNDGSTDYKNHHMVDSLAFGHCDFFYRNQGRYSAIKITHDERGLEVRIDDQPCFSSDKIALPKDYYFGMTAATADNPDSFEVHKFEVVKTHDIPHPGHFDHLEAQDHPLAAQHDQHQQYHLPNAPEQLPDRDAASIKRQDEQFADLHNRLQGLSHQVNNLFAEFDRIGRDIDRRHGEVLQKMSTQPDNILSGLNRRLDRMEHTVEAIKSDVSGRDYSGDLHALQKAVQGVKSDIHPETLQQIVKGSAPKITTFVFIVIAVQVLLLGAYIVYKRRRNSAPKKYL